MRDSYEQYLIVGGGKTGIDAVLYLLGHGVDSDKIAWIVPNDSWFLNRDLGITFIKALFGGLTVGTDTTWQDVYLR